MCVQHNCISISLSPSTIASNGGFESSIWQQKKTSQYTMCLFPTYYSRDWVLKWAFNSRQDLPSHLLQASGKCPKQPVHQQLTWGTQYLEIPESKMDSEPNGGVEMIRAMMMLTRISLTSEAVKKIKERFQYKLDTTAT